MIVTPGQFTQRAEFYHQLAQLTAAGIGVVQALEQIKRHPPASSFRAPLLDELADEYQGKVSIGKVNIDEQQALATQYGIRAIPTLLLINKGQVAEQMVGAKSKRDLKASLDRVAV